ncbi:DUF3990 domain-containing protein [Priestia megaterium]|uniref:DUF3990 domain-containing protein n=1 Tax=Priestia megaterium TaxID=1404 RepID=UPI002EC44A62|nr:DUF3990 domain-containing protein [Priestia megaterium]
MIVTEDISQLPRMWYHGTTSLHLNSFNRNGVSITAAPRGRRTDFGRGFYLTSNWEQAYRWAKGACDREMDENPQKELVPIIVECEIDTESFTFLKNKMFTHTDLEWANFILGNRIYNHDPSYHVKGKVDPKSTPVTKFTDAIMDEQEIMDDSPYHYVYGPMADGRYLKTYLERVRRGHMRPDEFLDKAVSQKYKFPVSHQLSINTFEALRYLHLRGVFNIAEGNWQHPVTSKEA